MTRNNDPTEKRRRWNVAMKEREREREITRGRGKTVQRRVAFVLRFKVAVRILT